MRGLRILLAPLSLLYGAAVLVRNWLFDIGVLPTTNVSVPVVSVGNISTGGTGKTPLVEYLARYFKDHGKKVAIISRGYKRTTSGYVVVSNGMQRCAEAPESGDEPSQMAEKLDGVVVAVDEQRVRAAQNVLAQFKPDVILLDDGFQHRYLHRDLNIVVVASDDILLMDFLLPAGNRREPVSSLKRADVVVISQCDDEQMFSVASARAAQWVTKQMVGMCVRPTVVRSALTRSEKELGILKGKRVVAFSGIGSPDRFEEMLKRLEVELVAHHRFADHHRYSKGDLDAICRSFESARAEYIITTEKDIARLRGDARAIESFFTTYPVEYVEIQPDIIAGQETLMKLLAKL